MQVWVDTEINQDNSLDDDSSEDDQDNESDVEDGILQDFLDEFAKDSGI